jgi:hypothetical protein
VVFIIKTIMTKKGYKFTQEHKDKISKALKGRPGKKYFLGRKHSEETKQKIRLKNKGKRHSPKTEFKKGQDPWNKDKKGLMVAWNKGKKRWWVSPGDFKKGQTAGDKNPNWKGGVSFEPYAVNWGATLKRSIRERDHYTCQICVGQPEVLFVHHIDYDKQNCHPDNLITLCNSCHSKTNYNRRYWQNKLTIKQ